VNAPPLLPEILVRQQPSPQVDLPLAAEGVLRYVWESRFGTMLIEVKEGRAYVNGQAVQSLSLGPLPRSMPPA
jgi:hypothetical protein